MLSTVSTPTSPHIHSPLTLIMLLGYMKPLNINQNMELLGGDNKPNSLGKWILNAAGI
jgi:hypothetical protein